MRDRQNSKDDVFYCAMALKWLAPNNNKLPVQNEPEKKRADRRWRVQ